MGKIRRSTLLALVLLLLSVAGCKVSCTTANISSLKFSKDEAGTVQTKEFSPTDTIYARATVSNNGSNVTLKFSLVAEKVEGAPENTRLPNADISIEVPGNRDGIFDLHKDGGWPAGRYRVEVAMLYNGEQKDQRSDTFTIKGGSVATPSPGTKPSPAVTTSPPGGGDTPTEDDTNESKNSSPHGEH